MATKIVRYYALDICCSVTTKLQQPVTQLELAFSASAKLTERLHGSSEFVAARQPNHNGPVPTSKLHAASRVFLHPRQSYLGYSPFCFSYLLQMDGFEEFEARRRKKFDKQIDSRVMMGSTALDEGVDFH